MLPKKRRLVCSISSPQGTLVIMLATDFGVSFGGAAVIAQLLLTVLLFVVFAEKVS